MAEISKDTDKPGPPSGADIGPPIARVRDDDIEPHEGLYYISKLFKALAILLIFMLIAEVVLGLRQEGTSALGPLLIEVMRLIVFAGFIWGAGDLAVLLVESNHDLRAVRILLGRLNGHAELVAGHREAASPSTEQRRGIRPESGEHRAAG